jgi:hypothetical protein
MYVFTLNITMAWSIHYSLHLTRDIYHLVNLLLYEEYRICLGFQPPARCGSKSSSHVRRGYVRSSKVCDGSIERAYVQGAKRLRSAKARSNAVFYC